MVLELGQVVYMRRPAQILLQVLMIPTLAVADDLGRSVLGADPDLSQGAWALQMGQYDEGTRLTQEGLKGPIRGKDKVAALSNLCAGYVGLERFEEAITVCSLALESNPRHWRAYNNRAIAWLGMGRLQDARADVEAGLALNPDSSKLARVSAMLAERTQNDLNERYPQLMARESESPPESSTQP